MNTYKYSTDVYKPIFLPIGVKDSFFQRLKKKFKDKKRLNNYLKSKK